MEPFNCHAIVICPHWVQTHMITGFSDEFTVTPEQLVDATMASDLCNEIQLIPNENQRKMVDSVKNVPEQERLRQQYKLMQDFEK